MPAGPNENAIAAKHRGFAMNGATPAIEMRAGGTAGMDRKHPRCEIVTAQPAFFLTRRPQLSCGGQASLRLASRTNAHFCVAIAT